ncbi:MAG TPA: SRPBCC domain-containing protein [Casimicrobiaceae bacterium]|nr:SRPBCC domain-containing protein [Casimicrobiaceae bacterium]
MPATDPAVDVTVRIAAPAARVVRAFFEPEALSAWWQAVNAVTTPRILGPYAIEWPPTDFRDEVLGRLGGVFRGTVIQFDPARGFFVGDAYWLPPDGDPIGPMALTVTVDAQAGGGSHVRVVQRGFEESDRWRRYYDVVTQGWERALASLKSLLER